jgi:ATP-dependent DNA helicase 2 subunit 1
MFVADADGALPFHQVLRAVIQTFRNKILTSGSDLLSVCFFGTREKDNPSDLPNILLFADLDVPDADRILRLEQLLATDFVQRFGHADKEVPLGDALWTCSTIFGNCSVKVGTKRVFLFTNNDNPNQDSPALQAQAKQRAQDLRQLGIQIELFPLNRANQPFLGSKFYYNIVEAGEEGDLDQLDGTSKLQELLDRARAKEYKKRSQGRISFFPTPDTEIGIRMYVILAIISSTQIPI